MDKHSSDTDKVKKVTLTSSIEQVLWNKKNGAPGGKVGLEIITQLVGNNSEVSIQISDKSGKTFDTIKKKMSGNKLFIEVTVPDKAKDELFAEIKFSKLGLTKKSDALNLFPQIEIKNLKWDKKEARRGDILKITADVINVYEGVEAEVQIWEHDSDGAHDLIAKFPVTMKNKKIEANWEFNLKNDVKDIPRHADTESGYQRLKFFFRISMFEVFKDSDFVEFKDFIRIELRDEEGNPIPNERYKIHLSDGSTREGTLNNEAEAVEEDIPAGEYIIIFPDRI